MTTPEADAQEQDGKSSTDYEAMAKEAEERRRRSLEPDYNLLRDMDRGNETYEVHGTLD